MHRSLERSQNSTTSQFCFENRFILSQRTDRLPPLARMIFLSKQGGSHYKFLRAESQSRYLRKGTRAPVKALFENLEDGAGVVISRAGFRGEPGPGAGGP